MDKLAELYKRSTDEWLSQLHEESKVNKNQLDDEASEQSQLFANWAGLAAIAHVNRKEQERRFEAAKARADVAIRKDPVRFGLEEKPKEAAIKAVILDIEEVQEAYDDYMKAYAYDKVMAVAEKTMEGRKTMLRLEGDLWLGEYYSKVEIKDKQVDRFRERVADTRKRKERRKRR